MISTCDFTGASRALIDLLRLGKMVAVAEPEISTQVSPLEMMLQMVAFKLGMVGADGDVWADVTLNNFFDIGVETLRDLVKSVFTVNLKLAQSGHDELDQETLDMMLSEVCDIMWGPEVGEEHLVLPEVPVEAPGEEDPAAE